MSNITKIKVNGLEIKKTIRNNADYLCISDFVPDEQSSKMIINNWMRNKNTIEFIGLWEG